MTTNTSRPERIDPYANFKFHLTWNGVCVAGFSKVSALERPTQLNSVTLARGMTEDPNFEQWARSVWDFRHGSGVQSAPAAGVCRDLVLELYNETGYLVRSYAIYQCWPSEFVALPELDASTNAVAIQTLVLQHASLTALESST